jgi:hypothetical protein
LQVVITISVVGREPATAPECFIANMNSNKSGVFIEVFVGFENCSKLAVIFYQCRLTKVFIAVLCAFGLGNGRDS